SSAAHAFTLGRPDQGYVSRDEALAHAQDLVAAVDVPVSGDFENGYGHDPDTCAETVRLSAEVGLAGISIEDAALPDDKAYERELAVERIKAASAAARGLSKDFILVARADGIMNGHYDIEEAIERVRGYDAAGADCIYVPLPKTIDDLKRVIAATDKPVNVLVAGPYANRTHNEFAQMGAARLSLGSSLARVTHRAIHDTAKAFLSDGDFSGLAAAMPGSDVDNLLI
ncbi:MAG: isocitrate lyase/phosphoenolpyruvate mutase family protein, partial [Boseongicola sp.]|nr:isocitrate lyase/phosphoenolpyruvate mutase family protein [Boseongicola sp.]